MSGEARTCCVCGATEPRGGLALTGDLDRWLCRRQMDCLRRLPAPALDPDDPPVLQTPEQTGALIDARYERDGR